MILDIDDKELTQDELDLLESLIGKEKKKVEQVKPKPCKQELSSYKLMISTVCTICKSDYRQYFHMKFAEHCLVSEIISEEMFNNLDLPMNQEFRHIRTCGKCKEVLMQKDKEEIVDSYIRIRACFSGS